MKALEILAPTKQDKNYKLLPKVKEFLAKKSRRVLLRIFRLSRDRAWYRGAYFWRQVKRESWRLLAGVPEWQPAESE